MRLSNIEVANTTSQALAVNQPVNLGTIVRRYSCKCPPFEANGTQLILNTAGYYYVEADLTYEGTAAGDITFGIYSNGVLIPYSALTETVAVGDTLSDHTSVIIRVLPNAPVTITLVPTGIGATVTKSDVKGIKIV